MVKHSGPKCLSAFERQGVIIFCPQHNTIQWLILEKHSEKQKRKSHPIMITSPYMSTGYSQHINFTYL